MSPTSPSLSHWLSSLAKTAGSVDSFRRAFLSAHQRLVSRGDTRCGVRSRESGKKRRQRAGEREREREGERRPCSGNLQDSAAAAAGLSRSQLFLRWHPCSCSSAPASLACCCHMCAGFCCCAVSLTRSCHFFLFTLSPHQDGSSGSQAARHPPREQGGRTE